MKYRPDRNRDDEKTRNNSNSYDFGFFWTLQNHYTEKEEYRSNVPV